VEVFRNLLVAVLLLGLVVVPITFAQDEDLPSGDQFFAGSVTEYSGSRISVSRTVRGQTEGRSFRVTSSTRIDGYLTTGVRVTVRFVYEDGGETATMIIVRTPIRD
jgi:hypothetical protein